MNREFHSYSINKTGEKAEINLFDAEQKLIEVMVLNIITSDKIIELIKGEEAIIIENGYLENFGLDDYRKKYSISEKQNIRINGIKISKSIISHPTKIDFSQAEIRHFFQINDCFVLQSTDFNKTKVKAELFAIENSLVQGDEFSMESIDIETKEMSFKNTIFRDSEKNFQNMQINAGFVNFVNTHFGKGEALFTGSKFSEGRKSFKVAEFGKGRTDFSNVFFNEGDVSFEMTKFGSGTVNFRSTIFGNGKIEFLGAQFGDGDINFTHTIFGDGTVSFKNTNFGNGKVAFKLVEFGNGIIDFHFSVFKKGDLQFDRTNFGSDSVDFRAVDFGDGKVSFNKCRFYHGDFILEASELKNNQLSISQCIFEQTNLNIESVNFDNSSFQISDSDLQTAKISFSKSIINQLIMKDIQIENYVDLRLAKCDYLDLSDTIIKGILNITPDNYTSNIKDINMGGMRLLGRIYLDWERSRIKEIILNQSANFYLKAEQFRILKQNYNAIGQYDSEDAAYVEFKRAEARAKLKDEKNEAILWTKMLAYTKYFSKLLIFDKVGKYATDPIRVLFSMLITYLIFSFLYIALSYMAIGDIHSSLFTAEDPRNLGIIAKAFYHSAITFLTIGYGDFYPSGISRFISGVEGFIGLFLMSYFTVAFVRKILR